MLQQVVVVVVVEEREVVSVVTTMLLFLIFHCLFWQVSLLKLEDELRHHLLVVLVQVLW